MYSSEARPGAVRGGVCDWKVKVETVYHFYRERIFKSASLLPSLATFLEPTQPEVFQSALTFHPNDSPRPFTNSNANYPEVRWLEFTPAPRASGLARGRSFFLSFLVFSGAACKCGAT